MAPVPFVPASIYNPVGQTKTALGSVGACLGHKFTKYRFIHPDRTKLEQILHSDFSASATWQWGEMEWPDRESYLNHLQEKLWNKMVTWKGDMVKEAPYACTDHDIVTVVETIQTGPTINNRHGSWLGEEVSEIRLAEEDGEMKILHVAHRISVA